LQELLGALHALCQFGPVQSFGDLRHADSGARNPSSILGAGSGTSNAGTDGRDYEGHCSSRLWAPPSVPCTLMPPRKTQLRKNRRILLPESFSAKKKGAGRPGAVEGIRLARCGSREFPTYSSKLVAQNSTCSPPPTGWLRSRGGCSRLCGRRG
jgi:hypothetical protein